MISLEEAESLINKLVTEEILVSAQFFAKEGPAVRLNGSVERISKGLMIWGEDEEKHPGRTSSLLLPIDETCEFGFQDKREIPPQFDPEKWATKYGNLMFLIRYPSGSFATLFFKD